MKNISFWVILGLLILSVRFNFAQVITHPVEFYVSIQGNDQNPGTKDQPFGSFEKARDAVREIKASNGHLVDSATIWIREGVYARTRPFVLDARDAGLQGVPVVYRAYPGEKVIIRGGVHLSADAFQPVRDKRVLNRMDRKARKAVYQIDMMKQGIENFGTIKMQGLNRPLKPRPLELFYNDKLMQLARWPNEGYTTYSEVTDEGSIPRYRNMSIAPGGVPVDPEDPRYKKYLNDTTNRPGKFIYEGDRFDRWKEAEEIWLFGYWNHRWAEESIQVRSVNYDTHEVTLDSPHHYGIKPNGEYYAFNLLEEIDRPGEYYLNRKNGMLYFWPPEPLEKSNAVVSIIEEPLVKMEGVSNVILRDLVFEVTRGNGIEITGGANNLVASCTIRNMGMNGIIIDNPEEGKAEPGFIPSSNNGIVASDISGIRETGIILRGGDRKNLRPGGNYVLNNHLHDEASVRIDGVGNRVAHNRIHDNHWEAINYGGNDHLIEFNEMFNCLYDADDAGVIYTGRNPSTQGTIIRYNYFHHNTGPVGHGTGSNGVYFDDGTTGQIVFGNIFYKTGRPGRAKMGATFVHGGKENIFANNIFIDCEVAVGFSSPWGQERWEKFLQTRDIKERLYEDVNITEPPFSLRYPKLGELKKNADVNYVWNNVAWNCREFISHDRNIAKNNWAANEDPGFVDAANQNFLLKKDALLFQKLPEFQDIPFHKIGLYKDQWRKIIP